MKTFQVYMTSDGYESLATDVEIAKKIIEAIEINDHHWDHDDLDKLIAGQCPLGRDQRVDLLNSYSRAFNSAKQVFNHNFNNAKVSRPHFESAHERKAKMVRKALIEKTIARLGGDKTIVVVTHCHDEEYGGYQTHTGRNSLSEELGSLYDDQKNWDRRMSRTTGKLSFECSVLRKLKTLKQVFEALNDYYSDCDAVSFIGTEEEYDKAQKERRRKELEGLAAEVARRHNVSVNSLEFLNALHKEMKNNEYAREEWNNPEVRMEEYAACRYAGVGEDVYYDDLNFVNGRMDSRDHDLYDIEAWVAESCPLLYAQYTEQRMSRELADTDIDELDDDEHESMN